MSSGSRHPFQSRMVALEFVQLRYRNTFSIFDICSIDMHSPRVHSACNCKTPGGQIHHRNRDSMFSFGWSGKLITEVQHIQNAWDGLVTTRHESQILVKARQKLTKLGSSQLHYPIQETSCTPFWYPSSASDYWKKQSKSVVPRLGCKTCKPNTSVRS